MSYDALRLSIESNAQFDKCPRYIVVSGNNSVFLEDSLRVVVATVVGSISKCCSRGSEGNRRRMKRGP